MTNTNTNENVTIDVTANINNEKKEEITMTKKQIKVYLGTKGGQFPFNNQVKNNEAAMIDIINAATYAAGYSTVDITVKDKVEWIFLTQPDEDFVAEGPRGVKSPCINMEHIFKTYIGRVIPDDMHDCVDYMADPTAVEESARAEVHLHKAMINGRKVADLAAIDHYVVSQDAQDIAIQGELTLAETYNYSENNDENCVVTRSEMIQKFVTAGYALPENYDTMSVKQLFWAYMNADQQAELRAEYNLDHYGSEHAPEEEEETVTVEEPKQANRARRRNPKAAAAMKLAHEIRVTVFGTKRTDLCYHAIMSICLEVAWAKLKGKEVSKEYPWVFAQIMNKVNHNTKAAQVKAAQELAKKNAETRKAKVEKKAAATEVVKQKEVKAAAAQPKDPTKEKELKKAIFNGLVERYGAENEEDYRLIGAFTTDAIKLGFLTANAAIAMAQQVIEYIGSLGGVRIEIVQGENRHYEFTTHDGAKCLFVLTKNGIEPFEC